MKAVLEPGAAIGILGGGQLGRMTALAAASLGYRVHVFTPEKESPAAEVCHETTIAGYDDREALLKFASRVDLVTFEFENIPVTAIEILEKEVPVRPGKNALYVTQNRLREKNFLNEAGVKTTRFMAVENAADLADSAGRLGFPFVLKTAEMGYDGKGQEIIRSEAELAGVAARGRIAEEFVAFEKEISVLAARSAGGEVSCYGPVQNIHKDHILDTTIAPAELAPDMAEKAREIAVKIALALEVEGILAVEMFVCAGGEILVNELAPRPHNSGHYTIDACHTSQFEQFIRAVCGLPLGSPAQHSRAVMKNLVGVEVEKWREYAKNPMAKIHLYGKKEIRPGRKMGHVTVVGEAANILNLPGSHAAGLK